MFPSLATPFGVAFALIFSLIMIKIQSTNTAIGKYLLKRCFILAPAAVPVRDSPPREKVDQGAVR